MAELAVISVVVVTLCLWRAIKLRDARRLRREKEYVLSSAIQHLAIQRQAQRR